MQIKYSSINLFAQTWMQSGHNTRKKDWKKAQQTKRIQTHNNLINRSALQLMLKKSYLSHLSAKH